MSEENGYSTAPTAEIPFLKRNLPDILTMSRLLSGFVILGMSIAGKNAYEAAMIITLVGAATDIFDGKAARRYLGENREGRLGRYDAEVDIIFLLCVLGYFTFAGVVIPRTTGFGWIFLVLAAIALTRKDRRVLIASEIVTVIALLTITLIYKPVFFWSVIVPVMAAGLLINRRRVIYLIFDYWPSLYLKRKDR